MNKHIEYLSTKLRMTPQQTNSAVFRIIDYLMEPKNMSEAIIDAGAYHNSPLNGEKNMLESYAALLWAFYEEIDDKTPEAAGPWVSIDPVNGGIGIHKERPRYVIV